MKFEQFNLMPNPSASSKMFRPLSNCFEHLQSLLQFVFKKVNFFYNYSMQAIITVSWYETALDYKQWILDPKIEKFPYLVLKLSATVTLWSINHSEKRGKNIKAGSYNGARTVYNTPTPWLMLLLVLGKSRVKQKLC